MRKAIIFVLVILMFSIVVIGYNYGNLNVVQIIKDDDNKLWKYRFEYEGEKISYPVGYNQYVECTKEHSKDYCAAKIRNDTVINLLAYLESESKDKNETRFEKIVDVSPIDLIISVGDLEQEKIKQEIMFKVKNCTSKPYQFWINTTQTCVINEFRSCIKNGTWFWNESNNKCVISARDKCRLNKSMQWVKKINKTTNTTFDICEYSEWREWYWKRMDCYDWRNKTMWWDNSTTTCRQATGLMVTQTLAGDSN